MAGRRGRGRAPPANRNLEERVANSRIGGPRDLRHHLNANRTPLSHHSSMPPLIHAPPEDQNHQAFQDFSGPYTIRSEEGESQAQPHLTRDTANSENRIILRRRGPEPQPNQPPRGIHANLENQQEPLGLEIPVEDRPLSSVNAGQVAGRREPIRPGVSRGTSQVQEEMLDVLRRQMNRAEEMARRQVE